MCGKRTWLTFWLIFLYPISLLRAEPQAGIETVTLKKAVECVVQKISHETVELPSRPASLPRTALDRSIREVTVDRAVVRNGKIVTEPTTYALSDRPIGSGGFSDVYRATTPVDPSNPASPQREVVIKILKPIADAERQAEHETALKKEYELLEEIEAIENPRVSQAKGLRRVHYGEADRTEANRYFLKPEYIGEIKVGGERLGFGLVIEHGRKNINFDRGQRPTDAQGKSLSIQDTLAIHIEIAKALRFLHRHGISHFDIKPENILIYQTESGNFEVKIIDFNIASSLSKPSEAEEGVFRGTPLYAAPERFYGEPGTSKNPHFYQNADLWALSATLYEAVTSTPPFPGNSVIGVFNLIRQGNLAPPPPSVHLSPRLQAFFKKAFQKEPRDRFQSAAEILSELDAIQKELRTIPIEKRPAPQLQLQQQ